MVSFKGFISPYVSSDLWIRKKTGIWLTVVFLVFMIFDFVLSGMTMIRYVERSEGVSAANELERTLDTYYDDDKMEQIYPNMQIVE